VLTPTRTVLLAMMFSLLALPALADDHREAARELMQVSGTEQIMAQMQLQIESMFLNISGEAAQSEAKQKIAADYRVKVAAILKEEMMWDKIEGEIIDLYMKSFSEAELKEMTAFYKTPLGQKMIEKMPEVMLRSAEISRQQMRYVIPRVKQLAQEMTEKMRASE